MKNMMHSTRIDLPEAIRKDVIALLNKSLATTSDLYAQLKQAHWNVKGMEFIALHKLFDQVAQEVLEQVDIIAERITSLGGTALGTLQQAVHNTALPAYPIDIFASKDHVKHVADSIAHVAKLSRENIKKTEELEDMATNDLYIDLVRMLDKNLWFVEAHIQQ